LRAGGGIHRHRRPMTGNSAGRYRPLFVLVLGILAAGKVEAQSLTPRRLAPTTSVGCPAGTQSRANPIANRTAADSLVNAGSQAAILGDNLAARDLLREAARMDPSNAVVSYRLARTMDELGQAQEATLEYCRYLSLAPTSADTADVNSRVRELVRGGATVPVEPWRAAMNTGLEAFDARRFTEAVDAFTAVLELRPDLADAYYNRAVARLSTGSTPEAAGDLEEYLARLGPGADDVVARAELERLRAGVSGQVGVANIRPPVAPRSALVRGLVLPGLGQQTTGRPILGLAVLGGVAGALYYGFHTETVVTTRGAFDPFGNHYEYPVTVRERPHQTVGIAAAAGIAVAGALESYFYAARQQSRSVSAEGPTSARLRLMPGLAGFRLEILTEIF
jgi:hypothetical protein